MPLTPIKANQFLQQLNGKSATLYLGLASAQPSDLQDDGCTTNEILDKNYSPLFNLLKGLLCFFHLREIRRK